MFSNPSGVMNLPTRETMNLVEIIFNDGVQKKYDFENINKTYIKTEAIQ
jgi:hypothetical protein